MVNEITKPYYKIYTYVFCRITDRLTDQINYVLERKNLLWIFQLLSMINCWNFGKDQRQEHSVCQCMIFWWIHIIYFTSYLIICLNIYWFLYIFVLKIGLKYFLSFLSSLHFFPNFLLSVYFASLLLDVIIPPPPVLAYVINLYFIAGQQKYKWFAHFIKVLFIHVIVCTFIQFRTIQYLILYPVVYFGKQSL